MSKEFETKIIEQLDTFVNNNENLESVEVGFLAENNDVRIYIVENHEQYDLIDDTLQELTGEEYYGLEFIQVAFYDEYTFCHNCNGHIHTTPTSAFWVKDWWISDNGRFCSNCVKEVLKEEYVEYLNNNYINANTILSDEELQKLGWKMLNVDYTVGMNYGYRNNPQDVFETLSKEYENLLFSITSSSPFDTSFTVYIKIDV